MREQPQPGWTVVAATAIILVHIGVLVWISSVNGPNIDELAHLPAGISHWEFGRFDLYRVNPPLVRMVAAVPVLYTDAGRDWSSWHDAPFARPEFSVGVSFVEKNGFNIFGYFRLARFACIPFSVLGCLVAYRWATELYGWRSGLTALLLYASCPNLIAWGASMTPDAASASTAALAVWTFWNWLRQPTWRRAVFSGITLGIAQLTKSTWIFLPPIYVVLWLIHRRALQSDGSMGGSAPARQLAFVVLSGVYLINLGYGFEQSFSQLKGYPFVSRALSGEESPPSGANRFAGTFLGKLPVPLPMNYLRGIDVQKRDFERGKWSYLLGEQKRGGWWYYYIYAFLVKTPVAVLVLVAWALSTSLASRHRPLFDELVVLAPVLFVFLLVSSQLGFNRYYRYVLPALPFLYVYASRVARRVQPGKVLKALLLTGAVVEAAAVLPHSMSFFNAAAGGPLGGPRHLLDANIDWGQDLLFLKRWYDKHPGARPLHVAYFSDWDIPPAAARIDCDPVPQLDPRRADSFAPSPGWYAVSVNYVYGYHYFESDRPVYAWLRRFAPVGHAGYSIYIYRITSSQLRASVPDSTAAKQKK